MCERRRKTAHVRAPTHQMGNHAFIHFILTTSRAPTSHNKCDGAMMEPTGRRNVVGEIPDGAAAQSTNQCWAKWETRSKRSIILYSASGCVGEGSTPIHLSFPSSTVED